MIPALPRFTASAAGCATVSRRKKNAIFEVAARLTLIAEKTRSDKGAGILASAQVERRKALKLGLEQIARGADHEALDRAFAKTGFTVLHEPGDRLENLAILEGLHAFIAGDHPFVLFRRMTAFLGLDYIEKSDAWLSLRIARRRRPKNEDLLIPGDLPDVLRMLARNGQELERVVRTAGRDILSASLAGCPRESLLLVRPLFGKIGGSVLEDNMVFLRARLSTEEIAGAQGAFIDIVREVEDRDETEVGSQGAAISGEIADSGTDPVFVRELTRLVLDLEEKTLRAGVTGMEGVRLAAAMQGMEPAAHERILGSLGKREEKRILDSIDVFDPLSGSDVVRAAGELIIRLRSAAERLGKLTETMKQRMESLERWK